MVFARIIKRVSLNIGVEARIIDTHMYENQFGVKWNVAVFPMYFNYCRVKEDSKIQNQYCRNYLLKRKSII